jgi:hypothetical protein
MELRTERLKLIDVMPDRAKDLARRLHIKAAEIALVRKGIPIDPETVKISEGERAAVRYITTPHLDRDEEIIIPDGGMLDDFRENPTVLFAHDYKGLPVGKDIWIKPTKKGILAKTQYANHQFAEDVYQCVKGGFLNCSSVGFIPVESVKNPNWTGREWFSSSDADVKADDEAFLNLRELLEREYGVPMEESEKAKRIYTKWILLEHSDVPVPSNPHALNLAVKSGAVAVRTKDVRRALGIGDKDGGAEKGAIPYHDHGAAPEGESWDGPAEVAKADTEKLKKMCAWYDSGEPDLKGSYKLPHHKADGLKAVWAGVRAAMGVLLGARGGVDIPEADRKSVYNHLAKEYDHWEKTPPDFKDYSPEEAEKIAAGEEEDTVCEKCGARFNYCEQPEIAMGAVICPNCGRTLNQYGEALHDHTTEAMLKPETTEEYHHIPVRPASDFVAASFRTIDISKEKGIKAVIGKLKSDPDGPTHVQKYLFDVDKWSMSEAQAWVDEHKAFAAIIEIPVASFIVTTGIGEIVDVVKTNFDEIKAEIKKLKSSLDNLEKRTEDIIKASVAAPGGPPTSPHSISTNPPLPETSKTEAVDEARIAAMVAERLMAKITPEMIENAVTVALARLRGKVV